MFKARFFLEAIENKNTEQITIAKAESNKLITDNFLIVYYFNKTFFELIKKYDEKNINDKLILRSFPVNVISDEEHTIFELDAKFCKDNIKFKNIEPFIKRHWQDSDKFLFIYETKHFTKSVLGKAFSKSA